MSTQLYCLIWNIFIWVGATFAVAKYEITGWLFFLALLMTLTPSNSCKREHVKRTRKKKK